MEKFMLIFHGGPYDQLSPEEIQDRMKSWFAWIEKLNQTEQYVSGEALLPGGKDVKAPGAVTEGPYTEGAEVVGGYFIVFAKDFEEASALCTDYPDYDIGGYVQVRQVMNVEQ